MNDGGNRMRWAEALAIERLNGDDAPNWVAERIGELAIKGDANGVERFREIARRIERMLVARSGPRI